jgi:hypothetical protein
LTIKNIGIQEKCTLERMDRWEIAFAEKGTVSSACLIAGINRTTIYNWQHADTYGFRSRWENARESYADNLEELMHKRLHDPEGNRGSDVLLMFNLKAKRPDIYREQTVIVDTGAVDLLATLRAMPMKPQIDTEYKEIKEIVE